MVSMNNNNNFARSRAMLLISSLPTVLALVATVAVASAAAASPTKLTCDNVRCGWGSECVIDEDGRPTCKCPEFCIMLYQPVCGSDGRTYGNECELKRAACQGKTEINVIKQGKCDQSPSTKRSCGSFCPAIYRPVCGSDHKQYGNECELNVAACKSGKKITVANQGGCETFAPTTKATPTTNCNILASCLDLYKPVCSSDNVTYDNDCVLRNAICRSKGQISKAYDGQCETFAPTPGPQGCRRCPSDSTSPVCGSDGRTYANRCELEREACLSQREIKLVREGRCTAGPKCANCPDTTGQNAQVCGSDNKTYASECELRRAACMEQREITVKFQRPCGKIKVCPKAEMS